MIEKKQSISVLQDYSLLGRSCFYHSFKYINKMRIEILDEIPVF